MKYWPSLLMLAQWCAVHGYPIRIRTDNGPEFTSHHFQSWVKRHGIEHKLIQPGKPAQNGFIERFNRTYREDVLDAHTFFSLHDVDQITQQWIANYNHVRPHYALGNLPPEVFAAEREAKMKCNFE